MPHISRKKLSKKAEQQIKEALKTVLVSIGKHEEMETFLLSLISKTERIMLAKRLAIVILLKEEIPESTIASILNVTRETVARQRYHLELHGEGYEIALRKLAEEKLLQGFKKLLISLTRYSIRAAGGYVKPAILD